MDFKKEVERLKDVYGEIIKFEVDIAQPVMPSLDFYKSRHNLYVQSLDSVVKNLHIAVKQISVPEEDEFTLQRINAIIDKLDTRDINELKLLVDELGRLTQILDLKEEEKIDLPIDIPTEIYSELEADANEMQRCFNAGCYRSVAILCGRIIETVLHRKYFEATNNDLLEKSPGIGLGNLIAKMNEQNIHFDPGLTQQIHLINQVRIFSVHKKQQQFSPSQAQAQAMMLYTMDVVKKMFAEKIE
jgi:hypothetical protein